MIGLMRRAGVPSAALMLLAVLGAGARLTPGAMAQQSSDGIWDTHSEITRATTSTKDGDVENYSQKTESRSADGQTVVINRTREVNPDGSSREHQYLVHDDGKGNIASYSEDDNQDSEGNRKVHSEDKSCANGRCEVVIKDDEYDRNNLVTRHSERKTRTPNEPLVQTRTPNEPPVFGVVAPGADQRARRLPTDVYVAVSGSRKVVWESHTGDRPGSEEDRRCHSWTSDSGSEKLDFGTPAPTKTESDLPESFIAAVPVKGTLSRAYQHEEHRLEIIPACTPCGPRSEYGPCMPVVQPSASPTDCGNRDLDGHAYMTLLFGESPLNLSGDPLGTELAMVTVGHNMGSSLTEFQACREPPYAPSGDIRISGRELIHMNPGDHLTLKGTLPKQPCGTPRENHSCTVEEDVEVTITRPR